MAELPRYRLTRGSFDIVSVFGSLRAASLPGPVITAVLGMRGIKPSAVRNQVTRLTQRGLMHREKAGTASVYTLDESLQRGFSTLSGDADAPAFTGAFHGLIVAVPESRRSLRDRIVYAAQFSGYRQLRPGVLIGFEDAAGTLAATLVTEFEEAGGIRDAHGAEGVLWERCTLVPADREQARRWTEIAFDVRGLHEEVRALEQIAARSTEQSVDLATYYDGFYETSKRAMFLPSLPDELTPGLDAGRRVAAVMTSLVDLYAQKFAAEVVGTALGQPTSRLIRFLPDAPWVEGTAGTTTAGSPP